MAQEAIASKDSRPKNDCSGDSVDPAQLVERHQNLVTSHFGSMSSLSLLSFIKWLVACSLFHAAVSGQ